jgi:hypothetical protein
VQRERLCRSPVIKEESVIPESLSYEALTALTAQLAKTPMASVESSSVVESSPIVESSPVRQSSLADVGTGS